MTDFCMITREGERRAEGYCRYGSLPFLVGLALKAQVVEKVPTTEMDVKLDLVLCED